MSDRVARIAAARSLASLRRERRLLLRRVDELSAEIRRRETEPGGGESAAPLGGSRLADVAVAVMRRNRRRRWNYRDLTRQIIATHEIASASPELLVYVTLRRDARVEFLGGGEFALRR